MSTVTENPTSPNAIPVRYSSAGVFNGVQHQPSKSVLKPLPEDTWISPKHHSLPPALSPPLALADHTNGIKRRHSRKKSTTDNITTRRTMGEWTDQKEKIILGPYDYLFAHPGKDIRSALIKAFNAFLQVPPRSLEVITKVVGMLHTSSLLVDDVQDGSILRRGIPVAHNIFGTAQTINSANYVYFLALQELLHLDNKEEAIEIFTSEMLNLHRGQGMDLYWRDTLTCPTEDDYLEMVQNKTGGLFRLAVKLMQAESPEKGRIDCVPLVNLMGLVFQICDDYLNLSSSVYTKNKGLCEDLTEGKFSFPVIHSIRSNPSNLQLINILKQKPTDVEVKKYAVQYMEGTGSFEYTKKIIQELKHKAGALIAEMDGGSGKGQEVKVILDKMDVDR
ncbi:geranylgeranyl pyrophosphate synthetase [Exophiala dermatitidis]|uniref:Geranylgeranyl pyrophosphate synthetase AtmG n=2 Tax=Exophiala dermatitidis TaxID=5970 RepID=H6CBW7_EXODN|nr:geranylgeranyl pyrophosphate synthetase AtmG [Exophiala dermatitidis NIH/UT8656]KAJ4502659.1 geranylgeranyl pyrophosphate synthetase [Exophiala dermatitidis]EHY61264.1 geranylgeranyl pyrophosphate synthetase AtmG [Exophiala dermatitidis NIH/UT8656]KAJ4503501.1 geranylgeranyl pyrophosphate synthetase [Exophiala dermatitidis]KAJ4504103.1 geranylgeranyl pyrophosphate synthetase [Exophiala dermatitidis]KAJ4528908.1 geranylgeranyl pyrophosphate synthetase [Exophiala dermatitidis]